MTGNSTSDRPAAWRQERRTDAKGAGRAGRGPTSGARRGPERRLGLAACTGLALVCLAVGAVAFVLVAPPLGPLRDRLVEQVRASTGRTLVVNGPISATLFPRVVVSMSNVAVLPPENVEGAPTVTVPSLEVETSLRSLLSRRPKLNRVTLHRPTLELAIDAQGRRSWDIAASSPHLHRLPSADAAGEEGGSRHLPEHLHKMEGATSIGAKPPRPWAVRVVDGTVRYRDERSGTRHEIGAINFDFGAENRGSPAVVNGSFAWQGQPWRFSGTAAHETLEGRRGPVSVKLAGAAVEAAFEGTLAMRRGFSAEGGLSLGPFAYNGVKIGPSELAVSFDAGIAKVKLVQVDLYDGRGQGMLTLDTAGGTPALTASLKLAGVSLLPLLSHAGGIGWIDGRGTVALDLTAQGRSEQEIVGTMQGKAQLAVADGALTGIDVDRSLRALQRGRLDRLAPRPEDRTPFSELSGTFDIADGVAKNQDLKLASTHLQLSGEGTVELARHRIDYTLQTKIAGGPPDDGAALRIGTIELPISVKGPLDRPEFAIKGQEGLTDAIRQIGRNLRSREVQDAIKGLIGGESDKHVKPSELIERLLKKE